jgi:hypothetical protein
LRRGAWIVEYICNVCRKRKEADQNWRLGFEKTIPTGSGVEKEIVVLHTWDEKWAQEPNALHFCSEQCEQKYLSVWYGEGELAAA